MSKGSRYHDMGDLTAFAMLASALGDYTDAGNPFPRSDADDISKGARFIPGQVTDARRAGETVEFYSSCQTSTCCWYWKMPDGSRMYHYEEHESDRLQEQHGGVCPECGNSHILGGTIA